MYFCDLDGPKAAAIRATCNLMAFFYRDDLGEKHSNVIIVAADNVRHFLNVDSVSPNLQKR